MRGPLWEGHPVAARQALIGHDTFPCIKELDEVVALVYQCRAPHSESPKHRVAHEDSTYLPEEPMERNERRAGAPPNAHSRGAEGKPCLGFAQGEVCRPLGLPGYRGGKDVFRSRLWAAHLRRPPIIACAKTPNALCRSCSPPRNIAPPMPAQSGHERPDSAP